MARKGTRDSHLQIFQCILSIRKYSYNNNNKKLSNKKKLENKPEIINSTK